MQTQFHVLGSHIYSCNVSHVVAVCVNGFSQLSSGFLELSVLSVMDDDQVGEGCDLHRTAQLFKPTSHWAAQWLLIDFFLDAGWLHWYPGGLHRKAAGYKHISSDFYWCPMRAPVFHNRCVTSALSGRGEEWKAMANVFIRCAFHFKVDSFAFEKVLNVVYWRAFLTTASSTKTIFEKPFKVELWQHWSSVGFGCSSLLKAQPVLNSTRNWLSAIAFVNTFPLQLFKSPECKCEFIKGWS